MLALSGVGKSYPGGVRALDAVSLAIAAGEIVVVVGSSGCGKSTLLRIVCGLERPSEGGVALRGVPVEGPRAEIGMVFQEPRLLPWLSVADNVGFGLDGRRRPERAARISRELARVGLADKAAAWPRQLSGGEGQRVALARALIMRPQVVLLDEPFSALDAFTRADLHDHLLELWAAGRPTLMVVTHDVDEAVVLADRIVVMGPRPGRVVAEIVSRLPRPRERRGAAFDAVKQRVFDALARSRRPLTPAA